MVQIRSDNTDATQRYLGIVAAMNSKLQVGTTPGNPLLVQQWNEAQKQLKRIEANISKMNSLSNDAGAEASVAGYLLDSVRATFTLSGAVDEDHAEPGHDYVLIARKGTLQRDFAALTGDLEKALKRLDLWRSG